MLNNLSNNSDAILIVWPSGMDELEAIKSEIDSKFDILTERSYFIDRNGARDIIEAMYPVANWIKGLKAREIGTGKLSVFVFRDLDPNNQLLVTNSGPQWGNYNFLSLKNLLRHDGGSRSQVHVTNNSAEFDFHHRILSSFFARRAAKGVLCDWESLDSVFEQMNNFVRYCVLRKGEDVLSNNKILSNYDDIDILVENLGDFIFATGARKVFEIGYENRYSVSVNGQNILFDVMEIGDGDLPRDWQAQILLTRRYIGIVAAPNSEHQFFSFLYHVLFHKKSPTKSDLELLKKYFYELGEGNTRPLGFINFFDMLASYMRLNGYRAFRPRNYRTYYNLKLAVALGLHQPTLRFSVIRRVSDGKKILRSFLELWKEDLKKIRALFFG